MQGILDRLRRGQATGEEIERLDRRLFLQGLTATAAGVVVAKPLVSLPSTVARTRWVRIAELDFLIEDCTLDRVFFDPLYPALTVGGVREAVRTLERNTVPPHADAHYHVAVAPARLPELLKEEAGG